MSGYYIKTPFAGLWDILHPDNGDTVVARRSLEEDFSLGFGDRECWYSIDGHEVQ